MLHNKIYTYNGTLSFCLCTVKLTPTQTAPIDASQYLTHIAAPHLVPPEILPHQTMTTPAYRPTGLRTSTPPPRHGTQPSQKMSSDWESEHQPVAIVTVGMAGSGKTTFLQRINAHLHAQKKPPYVINLDPAVLTVPFDSHIDIRDAINYKEVMAQYNLGPNGAIMTSLNLFATKIDQVIGLCEKRTRPNPDTPQVKPMENIIVDTPGQIEVFLWSASGQIILESLASSFPTVIAYVIDTPRTASTSTFMSNMLYACSILYKTKLPMILVFNKTDVKSHHFAKDWMTDYEAFTDALNNDPVNSLFGSTDTGDSLGGSGYMGSLLNSMSLMLEEFYQHLRVVGVSSMTGQGVNEFFEAVQQKAKEFKEDYQPEIERKKKEREEEKLTRREKEVDKLMQDMNLQRKSGNNDKPEDQDEVMDSDDSEGEIVGGDDDGDRKSLQSRYQEQLGAKESLESEASFAKYIYTTQI